MVGIVKVDTLQNNAGTSSVGMDYVVNGSAKAWVDASGAAVLLGSFAISSGTDNGTGDYSYAFSNAFTDVHFAQQVTSGSVTPSHSAVFIDTGRTTSVMRLETSNDTTNADKKHCSTAHGDLA